MPMKDDDYRMKTIKSWLASDLTDKFHKSHVEWLVQKVEKRDETINQQAAEIERLHQNRMVSRNLSLESENQVLRGEIGRLRGALERIKQLGWSDSFGGGHIFTGESHAEAVEIARQTLDGDS